MSLYRPAYRETIATTRSWHDWLMACETGEPGDLVSITDVCASAKVIAILHDETGAEVGRVDADGSWVLR